jgi:glycosyltransferase involved in cell wall biosynthesis
VEQAARRLGVNVGPEAWAQHTRRQAVFLTSQFTALRPPWPQSTHALGLAYYHGRPGTPGHVEFDRYFAALRENRDRFAVIQVTHGEMHELVCEAGVDPAKVFTIPIGIDLENFPLGDGASRAASRRHFGLPDAAFVVGSFQKDGVGWGEGLEPKPVKGPDLLVDALERLYERVPELFVFLLGPSRGFVRRTLERAGVPYRHASVRSRRELAAAYHALDAYVVASRQEGGPKGALEAMAGGAPLVSTPVGQVSELVQDGRNGLLVEIGDAEALAASLERVYVDEALRGTLRGAARTTAEAHDLPRLDPFWKPLLARLLRADAMNGEPADGNGSLR